MFQKIAAILVLDMFCFLLLLFILNMLCGCAPQVHSVPVTGALGRACESPTVVACDQNLSDWDCQNVHDACDYINEAAGMPLLRWTENDKADVWVRNAPAAEMKIFDPFEAAQHVMETHTDTDRHTGCFTRRWIQVNYRAAGFSDATRQTMFRHELLHALGLPHNRWSADSVTSEAIDSDLPKPLGLSPSDIAALRAIYHTQWF